MLGDLETLHNLERRTGVGRRDVLRLLGGACLLPACGFGASGSELIIGALLSLTGGWSTLGKASKVLLESAVADTNQYLSDTGSTLRVRLLIEDTMLDPSTCAAAFERLVAAGAAFIIGPQSSSEVRALQQPLTARKVVLLSQGSTASSLSIEGDNIFRFVPADTQEAEAVVALMKQRGEKVVMPLWRADDGNRGLAASVRRLATAAGLAVMEGIEYPAVNPSFSQVVTAAARAIATQSVDRFCVYLAAFDEVVDLFHAALVDQTMSSPLWYGSDGVALSAALAADTDAQVMAGLVSYVAPTVGLPDQARAVWEPLAKQVRDTAGVDGDAFAMAAVDSYWCALFATLTAGTPDQAAWKPTFLKTAEFFFGATGWGTLNAAGDRRFGNFDFWAIRGPAGKGVWTRVMRYEKHTWGGGSLVNLEASR